VKSTCFHWYLSDENIYYYLARDLSWNHLPYRDFFYANPPLLLFFLKLGGVLTGWSVVGVRLVPILSHVFAGFAILRIFSPLIGGLTLFPLAIYWFSYDSLRASTHATGIMETLVCIAWAYWAGFNRKIALSAFLLGIGLWIKTYTIVAIPGLVLLHYYLAVRTQSLIPVKSGVDHIKIGMKEVSRFLGVILGLILLLFMVGTLVGGKAFWEMNVGYHLSKQPAEEKTLEVFQQVLYRNQGTLYVFLLTIILGVVGYFHRSPSEKKGMTLPWLFLIVGTVHLLSVLVFLCLQGRIFDFYLLLFLPGLAFVTGGSLLWIKSPSNKPNESGQQAEVTGANPIQSGFSRYLWVLGVITLICLVHSLLPRTQRLFIRDLVSYWQHEARTVDALDRWNEVLTAVPPSILTGDSGTAPLVALFSHARLALGEADTNQMRFQGGFPPPAEFIRRLEEERVQWLVVRGFKNRRDRFFPRGMFSLPELRQYAQDKFITIDTLRLDQETEVHLMRRKPNG
jgi:hypothetical protein